MPRGTRRKSADDSASGAAASVPPPTRDAAAPAPPKKRGRPVKKRPLKPEPAAPAVTLEQQKHELEVVAGLARELATSDCGARDAAAALSVEARCRNKLIDLLRDEQQGGEIEALRAQIAAMERHLAGRKGSAQRADVAPAPRVARRPEARR